MSTKKQCTKCKTYKYKQDFSIHSRSSDGLNVWCKKCQKEYMLERYIPPIISGSKQCIKCKENKHITEFHINKKAKDGHRTECRKCAMRKRDEQSYRTKYGITFADYDVMFDRQQGKCAICGSTNPNGSNGDRYSRFPVDHCHKTGKVRGLLCSNCNFALGQFKDDPELLQKAIQYLQGE